MTIRLKVLCEDARTRVFLNRLLPRLGFDLRPHGIMAAPRGQGSAEQWIRAQYAEAVAWRRTKRRDERVGLLVVVDSDDVGPNGRRQQLAAALEGAHPVDQTERIGVVVPTRNIEAWLMWLLQGTSDEVQDLKPAFERVYTANEAVACVRASEAWPGSGNTPLSVADADQVLQRLLAS
ncbi:MAG: hypothetical protein IPG45_22470 [Deltaproteobacteria bacterium]|nr:hypothetical protein [Deltaproteobacteria bacterium]